MSVEIQGHHFYRRAEVRPRWTAAAALRFLEGFRGDAAAVGRLRELAAQQKGGTLPASASDEQVFAAVAQMMAAGDVWMATPVRRLKPPIVKPLPKAAAPAAARPAAQSRVIPEDEPTFGGNLHLALQVATLVAASAAGVPFCEQCTRLGKKQAA
jgi:hypothetical protein